MSDVTRSAKEGLAFGLIAGALFAIGQLAATIVMGEPAMSAFRRFASILLGPSALTSAVSPAAAVGRGLIANRWLSAMYGVVYGFYNSALTMATRRSIGRQAIVGTLFGLMLWLVNFRAFAPYRYPWMLELDVIPQLILHALVFGLPLGLLYATAERRVTTSAPRYSHSRRRTTNTSL
jgi:hypothetical protein